MGNKRRFRISIRDIGADHRSQVADIIRNTVGRLPEVQALDPYVRETFFAALVDAALFASVRFPTGRSDVSGAPKTRKILMSDVKDAMEHAGLPLKNWRVEERESTYYTIARLVSKSVRAFMPVDARQLAKRAQTVQRN